MLTIKKEKIPPVKEEAGYWKVNKKQYPSSKGAESVTVHVVVVVLQSN